MRTWAWNLSWLFGQVGRIYVRPDHDFTALEGFALGGTSVAQNQLGPYIQQAIDQVRQLDIH